MGLEDIVIKSSLDIGLKTVVVCYVNKLKKGQYTLQFTAVTLMRKLLDVFEVTVTGDGNMEYWIATQQSCSIFTYRYNILLQI